MKFSEHWLRTLVDPPIDSDSLAHALTMAGLEVEERAKAAPAFSGVVAARVLSVARHPNADRLTVCRVDTGSGDPLSIVCGAPNVTAGMVVPCALAGATLPAGQDIRKTTMRGAESQGMLCSAGELGISDDSAGLLVLDSNIPIGTDLRQALDLDDVVFTFKLTPNRADCLSVLGLAREISAITASPLRYSPPPTIVATSKSARGVRVEDPQACPRFCGRVISDIDATATAPLWMKQRLERSGIRSISAVVDVTNYVMLKLGQPLHAYDESVLEGDLIVRFAKPGERLTLLNGQQLALDPDLLLVADEKKALGLAGIMGGEHSGISDKTTSIFLEGAFWSPAVIQGKARRLGFATDAGFRFERGVDFANADRAVDRATQLILELCGGQAGPMVDVRGPMPRRDPVRVRPGRVARILGIEISNAVLADIFSVLGLKPTQEGADFLVTPPSFRFDLAIEEDFIEEAARLYGYDNIPASAARHTQAMLPEREATRSVSTMRQRLVDRDYQEVITFGFVSSAAELALRPDGNAIKVLNPIASQFDVMRTTLLGGLIETLRTNLNRKQDRVRVFETGRCFSRDGERYSQPLRIGGLAFGPALPEQWGAPKRNVDFFDVKGDLEALAWPLTVRTEAAAHPALHPGRSARVFVGDREAGWIGELHPGLLREFDLAGAPPVVFELDQERLTERVLPSAKTVSRLPAVRRDIAIVVAETIPSETVLNAMRQASPAHVEHVALFDVYRGPGIESGKKSLAILVLMQDTARTLTDVEIDATVADLVRVLRERFDASIRN
ncbi:MAG: phenylalanine--tRNA ligase subunit beta [Betaproteobacteria bacterium]|nr:MAG: phenylalanine--tRNA ligase subunit beta [Betaproteobacteria bacterium]